MLLKFSKFHDMLKSPPPLQQRLKIPYHCFTDGKIRHRCLHCYKSLLLFPLCVVLTSVKIRHIIVSTTDVISPTISHGYLHSVLFPRLNYFPHISHSYRFWLTVFPQRCSWNCSSLDVSISQLFLRRFPICFYAHYSIFEKVLILCQCTVWIITVKCLRY